MQVSYKDLETLARHKANAYIKDGIVMLRAVDKPIEILTWVLLDFQIEDATPAEVEQLREAQIPPKALDTYLSKHEEHIPH